MCEELIRAVSIHPSITSTEEARLQTEVLSARNCTVADRHEVLRVSHAEMFPVPALYLVSFSAALIIAPSLAGVRTVSDRLQFAYGAGDFAPLVETVCIRMKSAWVR
jgi:hypothetical protein